MRGLETISDIGPEQTVQLEAAGIGSASELAAVTDLQELSLRTQIPVDLLAQWQAAARKEVKANKARYRHIVIGTVLMIVVFSAVTFWLLRKYLAADPYVQARTLYNKGDYAGAQQIVDQSLAKGRDTAGLHNVSGLLYERRSQYDKALSEYQKAVAIDPKFVKAWNNMGALYLALNQPQNSVAAYDKAIAADPSFEFAYANKGSALRQLGRENEAIAALDKAVELDPKYAWAYNERGNVHLDLGEMQAAVEDYKKAIAADPKYEFAYANEGSVLHKMGQDDEALAALNKAVELDPQYVWAYNELGNVYLERGRPGDYERAIGFYNKALAEDAKYKYAYVNKGSALHNLGKDDEALAALGKAIEIDPKYALAYNTRGNVYEGRGGRENDERAVADYDRALKAEPTNKLAFLNKGSALHKLGRDDEALAAYDRALKIDPKYVVAYNERGDLFTDRKETEKALAEYSKAIEAGKGNSGALFEYSYAYAHKGAALNALGKRDEAIAALGKAVELRPNYVWAYNELGNIYLGRGKQGDYEKAIADYKKAVASDPQFKVAYANMGSAFRKLGRNDEALAALSKAVELDPKYVWAYNERGNVYLESEPEKAIAEFNKAIDAGKGDATAVGESAFAYAHIGYAQHKLVNDSAAIAALDKAVDLDPKYAWAYNERGNRYLDRGNKEEHEKKDSGKESYEKALDDYNRAVQADPNYKYAYANEGLVLEDLGRHDDALKALNEAIEIDPQYVWAYNQRGDVYADLHDDKKAAADYEKAAALDPTFEDAYLGLRRLARYDEAVAALDKFIQLDPKNSWAYVEKGIDLRRLERYDEALAALNKAVELDPKSAVAYGRRGDLYHDYLLQYGPAYDDMKKVCELEPNSLADRANFAEAALSAGHFHEARETASQTLVDNEKTDELGDDEKLSMRLIRVASLLLQGNVEEGEKEIDAFLEYYGKVSSKLGPSSWSFTGTRNFIEHQEADSDRKTVILEMIHMLESAPSQGNVDRIRALEATLK